MDKQLEQFGFGHTLELSPSCYTFGTNTDPPFFASSTCHIMVQWFLYNGFTLIWQKWNTYIVQELTDLEAIRSLINDYFVVTGNQCIPFT